MSWLDKVIEYFAPNWAYRRAQFRAALKQGQQPAEPRRDEGRWMGIDDERNPLNPDALQRARAERLAGKRWL